MKRLGFILFSGILFFGCSTVPEPADTSSGLVIGKIVLAAKGYDRYGAVNVNGISKSGITITIENLSTHESTTITSGKNGFFFSVKLHAGEYMISKCFYQCMSRNAWAEIYVSPGVKSVFHIADGKVNNLGVIHWLSDRREGTSVQFNSEYSSVHDDFSEKYKTSKWLNYEWIDVPVGKKDKYPLMNTTMLPLEKMFF